MHAAFIVIPWLSLFGGMEWTIWTTGMDHWNGSLDYWTHLNYIHPFCCAVVSRCTSLSWYALISSCCIHICHSMTVGGMLCGKVVHIVTFYTHYAITAYFEKLGSSWYTFILTILSSHILEKLGSSWYKFSLTMLLQQQSEKL